MEGWSLGKAARISVRTTYRDRGLGARLDNVWLAFIEFGGSSGWKGRVEFGWQFVTQLDEYHLLIGRAISNSLVDGMIERFKMKIEIEACPKHIHITGSFFARALL
ncbi:uncharacterized protein A4U43_C05F19080 [Asparagus officinalis]|uniref:Uncharacterized protein n=1 Tax=Asparagus officinalis TaxID=4686 RepID=A0A5P1EY42_ASPOF|nr:uncharacterized protein A4U43_C05F19080 [Asparagus officinalis]